jgi:hypothetical protein
LNVYQGFEMPITKAMFADLRSAKKNTTTKKIVAGGVLFASAATALCLAPAPISVKEIARVQYLSGASSPEGLMVNVKSACTGVTDPNWFRLSLRIGDHVRDKLGLADPQDQAAPPEAVRELVRFCGNVRPRNFARNP